MSWGSIIVITQRKINANLTEKCENNLTNDIGYVILNLCLVNFYKENKMNITFNIKNNKAKIIKVEYSTDECREINELEFGKLKELFMGNLIAKNIKTIIKDFDNKTEGE